MTLEEYFNLKLLDVSNEECITDYRLVLGYTEFKCVKIMSQSVKFLCSIKYNIDTKQFERTTLLRENSNLNIIFEDGELKLIFLQSMGVMKVLDCSEFPFDQKEVKNFIKKKSMRAIVEKGI